MVGQLPSVHRALDSICSTGGEKKKNKKRNRLTVRGSELHCRCLAFHGNTHVSCSGFPVLNGVCGFCQEVNAMYFSGNTFSEARQRDSGLPSGSSEVN